MEKEDYLPLFITSNEPILIYIVDNKLIDFDIGPANHGSIYLPFYFLGKIASNDISNYVFPKELLKKHADNFQRIKIPWPCLSGYLYEGDSRCLAAKLVINEDFSENKIIQIKNFAYIDSGDRPDCSVSYYDLSVELTAEEAFHILSNILIDAKSGVPSKPVNKHSFNEKAIRSHLKEYYEKQIKTYGTKHTSLLEHYFTSIYCLDYIVYLRKQVINGKISPEKILFNSGIHSLASMSDIPKINSFIKTTFNKYLDDSESLSFNQKICHLALLLICEDEYSYHFPELELTLKENPLDYFRLELDFMKKIYRTNGIIESHQTIYKKYL
ncbi:MAG: hypothetical protein FK730_14605 [Asgard group archaeon]|nr:hypothetical protein [Asgard group archaeon]